MKELTWKHVTIILAFLGALVFLTAADKETGAFVAIGVAILGGLGLVAVQSAQAKEQTTVVKEQTNGNLSRLVDVIEAQGKMLAAMQPAAPDAAEWTPPKAEP